VAKITLNALVKQTQNITQGDDQEQEAKTATTRSSQELPNKRKERKEFGKSSTILNAAYRVAPRVLE